MGSILAAVQVIVTSSEQPQPVTTDAWNMLSQSSIGGFQIVVLYLIVLGLLAWWFLDHTPAGRWIYATGGNPDAARLSGVRVDRWSWLTLILSGTIAGIGGILYTSLTGPSLSFGSTLVLPAFAAAFLGSTQLQPGRFNVWGTLIAIYVLATGVEGLQIVSGQQWLSDMFDGVALILAVALAVNRQGRSLGGKYRRKGPPRTVTEVTSVDGGSPAYVEPQESLVAPESIASGSLE
jgi:ribose transport system permease protein